MSTMDMALSGTVELPDEPGSAEDLPEPATVFIIDDDPNILQMVSFVVGSVGLRARPFETPSEFLEALAPDQSGCIVLDVRMPHMTGLQLQEHLANRGIRTPIIFITGHGEVQTATAAMRAGAVDFITKPFSPQKLLERIYEAIRIDRMQRTIQRRKQQLDERASTLTSREGEIMKLLAGGASTKLIASQLGISTKTVDNHRTRILEKMGVENTAQLACLISQWSRD